MNDQLNGRLSFRQSVREIVDRHYGSVVLAQVLSATAAGAAVEVATAFAVGKLMVTGHGDCAIATTFAAGVLAGAGVTLGLLKVRWLDVVNKWARPHP